MITGAIINIDNTNEAGLWITHNRQYVYKLHICLIPYPVVKSGFIRVVYNATVARR